MHGESSLTVFRLSTSLMEANVRVADANYVEASYG